MTFGNFVTRLRRRLQDIRTTSGTLIEDITTSGIRWTSEELIEIANMSLTELVRTANVYANSPLMEQIVGSGYFEAHDELTFAGVDLAAPSNTLAITSLTDESTNQAYAYLSPKNFYDLTNELGAPRDEDFFYTVIYDATNTVRKVTLSASLTGNLRYTAIYNKADYVAADVSAELYIAGMNDLLLDIAEREARDREHNWERSRILDVRIGFKFGVSLGQGGR